MTSQGTFFFPGKKYKKKLEINLSSDLYFDDFGHYDYAISFQYLKKNNKISSLTENRD